ncbi:MAG: AI-2E family transporter [Planctomycetaceae bacterium]
MARARIVPSWQNAIVILSGTVVSCIIVVGLQWGRPVLVPIALAILLTFLLNPIVKQLQLRGLGRMPAVMLGVSAAGLAMLLVGGLVARQFTILVAELPQNTANITAKIKTLRQFGSGPMAAQFEKMAAEISEATNLPSVEQTRHEGETHDSPLLEKAVTSGPAVVQTESIPWLGLTGYLSSALEVLATLAFSLILLVVFLIARDDLRDRVVVLAGRARVAVTSKALEDVTERISRYLLMVAVLNGGFGIMLGLGLFALQIPYAFLWGFLAGSLRFIPYIGPWIGAIGPIGLALATSKGWFEPLAVFGFVLVLELVSNNIIEPLVFGRSTGVSSTALIISAALWMYLWGPIGLVLSAPIAVCLMVVGKNIPQLAFLNLLLGSEPALRTDKGIYQRFMLRDELEATRLLLLRLKDLPAEKVFDEMLIPTLNYARRDLLRTQLTEEDHKLVLDGIQTSLGHTGKFLQSSAQRKNDELELAMAERDAPAPVAVKRVKLLICPGADASDAVALTMLRQSLSADQWDIEQTSVETLSSELVARIALDPPAIMCIAALPPRGLAHARYLCKRLRDSSPELQIIVGRWGQKRNGKLEREQLEQAGANFVTTSLAETTHLLMSRLPLLHRDGSIATPLTSVEPIPVLISAGNPFLTNPVLMQPSE